MESIANFFNQNPYMSFISFLVGITGVILTIVTFWIGKKFKRITYTKKTNTIVSLNNVGVDSLRLFYKDEKISDVSITRIAVWNSGKETIEKENIVPRRPLKVCVKDASADDTRILDCSVDFLTDENIFEDKKPSNIDLEKSNYAIPFDFIDPDHGMIIQVIHTGNAEDIFMDCQIKGGKDFELVNNDGIKVARTNTKVFGKTIIINMPKMKYLFIQVVSLAFALVYCYNVLFNNKPKFILILMLLLESPICSDYLFKMFGGIGIPKKIREKL